MINIKEILLLGTGGFFGTLARYYVQQALNKFVSFPFGTFVVNVTGCFVIGFVYGFMLSKASLDNEVSRMIKMFFVTGFCGGYTTFSSFGYESMDLLIKGYCINSFLYLILSIFLGLLFCYLGLLISKLIL